MLKIGWFSTGRGEGSRGLLSLIQDRIASGRLNAAIDFVFSNRQPGEAEGSDLFFRQVTGYGLPLVTFSSAGFARSRGQPFRRVRQDYDKQVMELLKSYRPDICVLAGYMLIVSGDMCRRYPLLNLHPALPDGPIGTWQDVIWELIASRATRTGAMMHLATEEVDRGPVVSYCTVNISGGSFAPLWAEVEGQQIDTLKREPGEDLPLFQMIRQSEYRKEPYLLLETIRAVAEDRISIANFAAPENQNPHPANRPALNLDNEILQAMTEDGLEPES